MKFNSRKIFESIGSVGYRMRRNSHDIIQLLMDGFLEGEFFLVQQLSRLSVLLMRNEFLWKDTVVLLCTSSVSSELQLFILYLVLSIVIVVLTLVEDRSSSLENWYHFGPSECHLMHSVLLFSIILSKMTNFSGYPSGASKKCFISASNGWHTSEFSSKIFLTRCM